MIDDDLYQYSISGYRTLVVAQRRIDPEEYSQFERIYLMLLNSKQETREQKLQELYDVIEQKMHFLGISALEDKLQDGVSMTIKQLLKADIRFFVITGDKLEAAAQIGRQCKIIQDKINLIVLNKPQTTEIEKSLERLIANL